MWIYWLVRTGTHRETSMTFCGEFQKNSKKCRVAIEFTDHKYDCVYYLYVYDSNRFTVCASKWQIEFFQNVNQVNMHTIIISIGY